MPAAADAADRDRIDKIARQTGFSAEAVAVMLRAVQAGNGGMAQFSHPEFGGAGQWMRGGMTMLGAMWDHALQGRVAALCEMLAALPAGQPGSGGAASFQSQSGGDSGRWWPADLGTPSGTGAQDHTRYAYFAPSHRLVVDIGGRITVYDTRDHHIGGFSQQQGASGSTTFISQHGAIDVATLPIVSGAAASGTRSAEPVPASPQSPPGADGDVFAAIEKLANLRAKGILSEGEFEAKKAELLARL